MVIIEWNHAISWSIRAISQTHIDHNGGHRDTYLFNQPPILTLLPGRPRHPLERHPHHLHRLHPPNLHQLRLHHRFQPTHRAWNRRAPGFLLDLHRLHGLEAHHLAISTAIAFLIGQMGSRYQHGCIDVFDAGVRDGLLPTGEEPRARVDELE